MKYIVRVIFDETGEIVKQFPCDSENKAEKIESGLQINLNHEQYSTEIIEVIE